jgi:hypothetical protein
LIDGLFAGLGGWVHIAVDEEVEASNGPSSEHVLSEKGHPVSYNSFISVTVKHGHLTSCATTPFGATINVTTTTIKTWNIDFIVVLLPLLRVW